MTGFPSAAFVAEWYLGGLVLGLLATIVRLFLDV